MEFALQTDASSVGLEAVPSQRNDQDGNWPMAYYSNKLLPRETRYSSMVLECLAMVKSIIHLTGVKFTMETDRLNFLDQLKDKKK